MSAGAFCGVAPFLFRKKASGFEGKSTFKTFNASKNNVRNMKASTVRSSCGVAGNFVTMTELRNKISTFRDLLDFSPCVSSASVKELMILTLNDLFKRYPKIKSDITVSEIKDATMHKALKFLCDALKSLGDLWTTEEWMIRCKYHSSMKLEQVELEKIALGMLDDIIKLARDRLFDGMDEDEEMRDYIPPTNAFGKALSESYSDSTASLSGSPATPTSVLPEAWKSSANTEKTCHSPPRLLPLRAQAIGKLNPIDVKRLSFHMFPHAVALAQDPRFMVHAHKTERQKEEKWHSEVKPVDANKVNQDCEMIDNMDMINEVNREPQMKADAPNVVRTGSVGKTDIAGRNWIGSPVTALEKQERLLSPTSLPKLPSNNDVIYQVQVPSATNRVLSVPSPLPPAPPLPAPNLSAAATPAPAITPRNLAPLPPPPPPPPTTSRENTKSAPPPPPPPPTATSKGPMPSPPPLMPVPKGMTPPPLPPPVGASKGPVPPLPPPLMPAAKGAAPPPPPGPGSLCPKKVATKLKRSSQMGSLYRLLKGKVEGSSLDNKASSGRKGKTAAASGGKRGMADALAEMTKRSAYFQQIEEDVKNYAGAIKEVKTAISSFQTSDMNELLKFHKYVESHLEKLTDETQVLARFEDFPSKKLEALRMAAALYSKLDSIASTLQNWPIVLPVGQLLDKAESYFNKIKVEIDALERTKDEETKKFQAHKINFDFGILLRIKELMVDVSSDCMELALKEKREARAKGNRELKQEGKKNGSAKILWKAFQFAYRVYTFAGGHDDRADRLTRELAHEIETES